MPEISRSRITLALFGLVMTCIAAPAFAQSGSLIDLYGYQQRGSTTSDRITNRLESARQTAPNLLPSNVYAPIDGALDPREYVVGPNDQFAVSTGGIEPLVTVAPVSADGYLVLPGAGRLHVAGKTLDTVQTDAIKLLQTVFENVPVEIALTRPREFFVHVNGAVPKAGKYLAMPAARVEDVLREVYPNDPRLVVLANPRFRPALRNVIVRTRSGEERSVDLVRYYRTGDRSHNPMLGDGDAIFVPAYDPSRASVFVDGDIAFPGQFDFRDGDNVLDLLALGSGGSPIQADSVRVTRYLQDGHDQSWFLSLDDLESGVVSPPELQPMDNVHVPRSDWKSGSASVEGAVLFPGSYAIRTGETTLRDLVDAAGGMLDDALVRGAYIERGLVQSRQSYQERDPMLVDPRLALPEAGIDTVVIPHELQLGDLDFFGMSFLARSLRLHRRVSVDVEEALRPGATSVPIRDGDRLVVPYDQNSVFVIGQVTHPGAVPFEDPGSADDFVRLAGGKAKDAGNVYIVRAGTGEIQSDHGQAVRSGDIVYVNREGGDPFTLEAKRLDLMGDDVRTRRYQLILQSVGTFLSVITTILLVENALGK